MRDYAELQISEIKLSRSQTLDEIADMLLQNGCQALARTNNALLSVMDPCRDWDGLPFKSMRMLCPLACGCAGPEPLNDRTHCPHAYSSCSQAHCTNYLSTCQAGTQWDPCSCGKGVSIVLGEA